MGLKSKNYIYAGLDFVFDHKYRSWFIEANAAPGGAIDYLHAYGKNTIIEKLADFMESFENSCILVSKKKRMIKNRENSRWVAMQLRKYIPINICFTKDNRNSKTALVNSSGKVIHPDCIFRHGNILSPSFEKSGVTVINPICVARITENKYRTIKAVKNTGVRIPETHIVESGRELRSLLSKKPHVYEHGFVIKPIAGKHGHGIHIFSEHDKMPRVLHRELLEQRVIPRLLHRRYWNMRTFVLNGKVIGGVMGRSHQRVTNLHLKDTKPYKAPKKLLKKLVKPSLKIVKAIDKAAEKIKYA